LPVRWEDVIALMIVSFDDHKKTPLLTAPF
jgi:hypothetical protein